MESRTVEEQAFAVLACVYHDDRPTLDTLLGELDVERARDAVVFLAALVAGTLRSVESFAAMGEGAMLPRLASRYTP